MAVQDNFQASVERIFAKLGLGRPRFTEEGRIRLRVESVSIDLVDSGTGRMLVEGSAGRLAPDGPARAAQGRMILESNLGLLVGNDAGVFVGRAPSGVETLVVRAVYRYRTGNLDRLVKKIEDVIRVVEHYAGELRTSESRPSAAAPRGAPAFEPIMIFRP